MSIEFDDEKELEEYMELITGEVGEGLHCVKCKAKKEDGVKLCSVAENGVTMVAMGTPGSHIECFDTAGCYRRRNPTSNHTSDHTSGYQGTVWAKCRHNSTEVFTLGDDLHFWGGSETRVEDEEFDDKWLIVSLLGKKWSKTDPVVWTKQPQWAKWFTGFFGSGFSPQVVIDWSDGQAPLLKPGFWSRLVEFARKEKFGNVLFYCIGGHGRTGTALCSTIIETCGLSVKEAVEYVREQYCKEAVETKAQISYLERLEAAVTKARKAKA